MPVFINVYYEHPSGGANSGGIGSQEVDVELLKKEWRLRPERPDEKEILDFLENAQPGQHLSCRGGGAFIFRSR